MLLFFNSFVSKLLSCSYQNYLKILWSVIKTWASQQISAASAFFQAWHCAVFLQDILIWNSCELYSKWYQNNLVTSVVHYFVLSVQLEKKLSCHTFWLTCWYHHLNCWCLYTWQDIWVLTSRLDVLNNKMFICSFMKFYSQQKTICYRNWFSW